MRSVATVWRSCYGWIRGLCSNLAEIPNMLEKGILAKALTSYCQLSLGLMFYYLGIC